MLTIEQYAKLAEQFEKVPYPQTVQPPLAVYGDFHGDSATMASAARNPNFKVLLGDYVDRGASGVFCLQMAVALHISGEALTLRGNHEDLRINQYYNFIYQLKAAYPRDFEDAKRITQRIYSHMKLFQLIYSKKGAIIAVHGGVPLGQRFSQIQNFAPNKDSVEQMLWSDPGRQYGPSSRGAGIQYDKQHFVEWAAKNGIYAVIRGHYLVNGTRDDFADGRHFTVFSAKNYQGAGNAAAWMLISEDGDFTPQIIVPSRENRNNN